MRCVFAFGILSLAATPVSAQLTIQASSSELCAGLFGGVGACGASGPISQLPFRAVQSIPLSPGGQQSAVSEYDVVGVGSPSSRTISVDLLAFTFPASQVPGDIQNSARIDVTLTSSAPLPIQLEVQFVRASNAADFTGSVGIGGLGQVPGQGQAVFHTILDSAGLVIDIDMVMRAFAPNANGFYSLEIDITPDVLGSPYGSPCGGLDLEYESTLTGSPTVTIRDPAALYGVLLIGTAQIELPLDQILPFAWPCPLRTDGTTAIPLPIGPPTGELRLPFIPPPGTFTMQAVTTTGLEVNTSNGLSFVR